jgi:hypothetical protein
MYMLGEEVESLFLKLGFPNYVLSWLVLVLVLFVVEGAFRGG